MAELQTQDNGDLRKYRTEIPNIVFSLGLSPFELALYCHLKKTAGAEGKCWKSTKTLAAETKMSGGQISAAKEALEKGRPELGGKALIVIDTDVSRPGRPRHVISIADVWPENFARSSPHELQSSPHELQSSPHELQSSPHEPKNKPREERTQKETSLPARARPPQVKSDNGVDSGRSLSAPAAGPIPDPAEHPANRIFVEEFGEPTSLDGQAKIAATVADLDLWRKTCRRQFLNKTPPKNAGTVLEIYEERLARDADGARPPGSRAAPPPPVNTPERQQELRERYYRKAKANA